MKPMLLLLCALAASAALALPSQAAAADRMEIAVQDDPVFVDLAYYDRERALGQARALGVTWIRANLVWADALGKEQARQTTPPAPPIYDWAKYDSLIDAAARYGIRVQLTLTGPAPAWATWNRRVGVHGPRPREFGAFARAAAQHFKGRVARYSIWNEPNYVGWLKPFDLSAAIYRGLYRSAYSAVKRVDRRAKVFIGETSPYSSSRRAHPPLRFLRAVTCTSRSGRRHRRGACFGLRADGYAHHPYDYRHRPSYRYPGRDNATVGTLRNLTSALTGMARAGALSGPRGRPLDVYLTEYGYFASGKNALGDEVRAAYLVDGFALAQRNPRVRQVLQYSLVGPPRDYPGSFFDLSIIDRLGRERAPFNALQAWSETARARGEVLSPPDAFLLPPAPAGRRR